MKLTLFVLSCLVIAATFCTAQGAPPAQTPDTTQSTPPAATEGQPAPQNPPPAKPSAAQPSPSADQAHNQEKDKDKDKDKEDKNKGKPGANDTGNTPPGAPTSTSNDRLFFALPNFLTVDKNGKIVPLTAGQKFKVVARGAFDPVQIPWYGILAGISQAENSEPGYGQGAEGYGKRWGAYAADGTIENFFVGAILPSIFRQDPRFFPSHEGSFIHRATYAVSRIVITRGDSGRREFNASEVLGSAISSGISTYSYHPRADRTVGNTASVWVSQMGYDAITIMLKEFWPDIRRKIKK